VAFGSLGLDIFEERPPPIAYRIPWAHYGWRKSFEPAPLFACGLLEALGRPGRSPSRPRTFPELQRASVGLGGPQHVEVRLLIAGVGYCMEH